MLQSHKIGEMPAPPRFRDLIGPSFILLGLGLGSGEVILWPYLASNYGLGIIWGAILGLTFQFFMNMEIERYALTRGESIFVGFARRLKWAPVWFIFSTLAGFVWPGIIAASAKLVGTIFGIADTHFIAIGMLILIGVILTLGPILYKTMERFTMVLIGIGVPALFLFVMYFARPSDWQALFSGIFNFGYLPAGIPIASFLAAFAFSGAGGNLNLAQSYYIKEKGYGMGKFGGRITSILTGKAEEISLTGTKFEMNGENISRFKKWWGLINREHFIVFWLTGAVSICLLALLAFSTTYGKGLSSGISFVIEEALVIGTPLFLVLTGLMLFSTQMTVMDATSRIMSENLLILKESKWSPKTLPKIYYSFLWAQILLGIIIFLAGLTEPLALLVLAAVINAAAMFVHIGATILLNKLTLEKPIAPGWGRVGIMAAAFAFFGYFLIKTILVYI